MNISKIASDEATKRLINQAMELLRLSQSPSDFISHIGQILAKIPRTPEGNEAYTFISKWQDECVKAVESGVVNDKNWSQIVAEEIKLLESKYGR